MLNAITLNTSTIIGLVIDAVLIIILAVFLCVGIKKGLIKMCCGLISGILVLVIAVMAVSPVTKVIIDKTDWDNKLSATISSSLEKKIPNAFARVYYYDTDGDPETPSELVFMTDNNVLPYDEIFEGNTLGKFQLQKVFKLIIQDRVSEDGEYVVFVDAISDGITNIIFLIIVFVAIFIVARIIVSILFYLLRKLVTNLYIVHFIDKLVGGILGIALGALVILCLITVLQLMQNLSFMEPVNTAISNSYITKFVAENNFLYNLIVEKINISAIKGK